ncbi:hypothetical protein [Variovorax terrae]|uniref:Uncharacterized protein n=1 Tax=Variovorax terrae TaxID=2923278 RepID=A0A9X2AQG9_9BURK|nr:hypothetical protein [Variovorax terrae]MCJ0764557.1 hypothetical protein [Variovorax terrae]
MSIAAQLPKHDADIVERIKALHPSSRDDLSERFAIWFDAIFGALQRKVTRKAIRETLAEGGVKLTSTKLNNLLDDEAARRGIDLSAVQSPARRAAETETRPLTSHLQEASR